MTKSDKIKQLKSSLKNTKAQLKRREAKKKRKTNLWSKI